jgi:DNA repair protein RadD
MKALRPYQQELYIKAREALRDHRAIFIQLPTGAGKTAIVSAILSAVFSKGKRGWIIVNRTELIQQTSEHLRRWSVPHGIISPNMQESRAYLIHIISKDTLIRRYSKIKNFPNIIIFDEGHLYLDRQIEIISHLPDHCKIIAQSASPERLDGRGLSEVYETLIEGPSIPELTLQGYLSPLKYYAPPLEGLNDLHYKGMDVNEEELESLLQRRKIYGQVVDHYSTYGKGKSALIFCRSVKSAYQTAERFRDKGYNFHCLEGKIGDNKRRELVRAHRDGMIQGLCGADIFIYGYDVPRVEYVASLRPTLSKAVYMQSLGRALRPFTNEKTGYKKEYAIYMDHCNNILQHQDDNFPGMPLPYVPHIFWNFYGNQKRKKNKNQLNVKLCPYLDFMYCDKPHCGSCSHNPDHNVQDCRKPMIIIPTELKEVEHIPLADMAAEDRREHQDKIGAAILDYKNNNTSGPIEELLNIADGCGYPAMWVYFKLTDENRKTINIPLLYAIAKIKNYKPGWAYMKIQELKRRS